MLIGIVAGFLARLLVPGRDPMGFWATVLLGVVGSFIGGFLGWLLFGSDLDDGALQASGIIGSIVGAVLALLIYRATIGKDRTASRTTQQQVAPTSRHLWRGCSRRRGDAAGVGLHAGRVGLGVEHLVDDGERDAGRVALAGEHADEGADPLVVRLAARGPGLARRRARTAAARSASLVDGRERGRGVVVGTPLRRSSSASARRASPRPCWR